MRQTIWNTAELRALGWSKRDISDAVQAERLDPIRHGHYASPNAPADLVRAARVGGVATATTATRVLGLWTPPDGRLHLALPPSASRLRDPDTGTPLEPRDDLCLHWTKQLTSAAGGSRVVPLLLALEHLLRCLAPEQAIAVVDSALQLRFLRPSDLVALGARLPQHLRAIVAAADGRCESGIESITRYLLQLAGLRVEVQVVIRGVGRVDLLVEGRLIIELDGRQWHDDPESFERDRRRDAAAAAGRYRTLRFTWRQVLFDWSSVEAAVFAALAA